MNVIIANIGVFVSLAMMDATFLMKIATLNITSTEWGLLLVLLKMETSAVEDSGRDSDNAVLKSFKLLEAWLNSRKSINSSTALYDELSQAFEDIKRADLVNFVRRGECTIVTAVYYNDTVS